MKKNIFFTVILIIISHLAVAQYTDVINANNPGKSIGAYSVGRKVAHVEAEFLYEQMEHLGLYTKQNNFSFNYQVRYGVWREQLEAVLDGTLLYNRTEINQFLPLSENKFGFYKNTLGAKYLVYNPIFLDEINVYSWKANQGFSWRRLIPAISVYAGANFFSKNRFLYELANDEPAMITPKAIISLQSHPITGVVLVANLVADNFINKDRQLSYIVTLTHNLYNERWSIFVENEGTTSTFYNDWLLRGGASFLASKDLQINAWLGTGWKATPTRYMGGIGISYRFYDRHQDVEYIEKKKARDKQTQEDSKIFGF